MLIIQRLQTLQMVAQQTLTIDNRSDNIILTL